MSEPAPQTTVSFPDTPAGRADLARYLRERFGPKIEYRPTFQGVEIRVAPQWPAGCAELDETEGPVAVCRADYCTCHPETNGPRSAE